MTQAAVAKKIPCSLPHLNATINNDRRLSGQKLFRLCEIANATKAERGPHALESTERTVKRDDVAGAELAAAEAMRVSVFHVDRA